MYHAHDAAPDPLFKFLDKKSFFSLPTYSAFYALLDNYERCTGEREVVTREEEKENWRFLDAILETPCMEYLHNYLIEFVFASFGGGFFFSCFFFFFHFFFS